MVSGERRWERALRAMVLGEDATNFRIKRLAAEKSSSATVGAREVRKRWPCLVSAHSVNNGSGRCR